MLGAGAFVLMMAWAGGSGSTATDTVSEAVLDCHVPIERGLDFQVEFQNWNSSTPHSNLSPQSGRELKTARATAWTFVDSTGHSQMFEFLNSGLQAAQSKRKSLAVRATLSGIKSQPIRSIGYCQVVAGSKNSSQPSPEKIFSARSKALTEIKTHYQDLVEIEEVRVHEVDRTRAGLDLLRLEVDFVREPRGPAGKAFYCTKGFQYEMISDRLNELQESCEI